jgi:hypothetical protein
MEAKIIIKKIKKNNKFKIKKKKIEVKKNKN